MKPKEAFLQNIKAKLKVLQDAYDFNKSLPDDVFESLFNSSNNSHELPIETKESKVLANEGHNGFKNVDINDYGAKREIIKGLIANKVGGVDKKSIINYIISTYSVDKDKAAMMVTNTITALSKSNEIEVVKRGKYRIKKE
jgi:hypothetical protein